MADQESSITKEEFENVWVNNLNAIGTVLNMSPQAIPEGFDQFSLMNTITEMTSEMRNSLNSRIPEISKLQKENDALKENLRKTQETNQQLNLQVARQLSKELETAKKQEQQQEEKPLLSFKQIKDLYNSI